MRKWIGLSLLVLLLAACGPAREQETLTAPSSEPAFVPVPTFTPTPLSLESVELPTVEATPTVQPQVEIPAETTISTEVAATEPPTPVLETPGAPEPVLRVEASALNIRGGPGTDYPIVGLAEQGASYPISGRNQAGDWWQICCVNGQPGWLYAPLVVTQQTEGVAVAAYDPLPPTSTPVPVQPVVEAPAPAPPAEEESPAAAISQPQDLGGTAGNFDPNAQFRIVHYRVLGHDDNNGGIFNKGGQQFIFVTVLDQNGAPIDNAVLKDAVGDRLNVVTGSKGSGKAEIKMDWDPYKLYVASTPDGAVTSQISNQMNNPFPHIPDVIGKLGPIDNEYALCPTPEINCTPPFFTVHFSYEITFQRVR